jgi:hypothetical protein
MGVEGGADAKKSRGLSNTSGEMAMTNMVPRHMLQVNRGVNDQFYAILAASLASRAGLGEYAHMINARCLRVGTPSCQSGSPCAFTCAMCLATKLSRFRAQCSDSRFGSPPARRYAVIKPRGLRATTDTPSFLAADIYWSMSQRLR